MWRWVWRTLPWWLTATALAAMAHAGASGGRSIVIYAVTFSLFVTVPGVLAWRQLWTGVSDTWLDQVVRWFVAGPR